MLFRAASQDAFVVRPVDNLTLLFHKPAGVAHVVSDVVVAILGVLHERTMSVEDIAGALRKTHEIAPEEEGNLIDIVTARLHEMAALDIIDRLP